MKAPNRPDNEQARLRSLYELELLDKDTTSMFEGAVELAAQITGCPIALVSLVDTDRQWFAAARNLEASETHRDVSFCGHAILESSVLVVPDARIDARFHDNPLVVDDPGIVFYAGAPLAMPDGTALGTVCVIDREPRHLSERQVRALAQLSRFVVDQLELRRSSLRLERQARARMAEHQRQSERLAALGRDLERALAGVEALVHQRLSGSEDDAHADLHRLLRAVKGLTRLGITIGESGMDALYASALEVTRLDPARILDDVLETYQPELMHRRIQLDRQIPGRPLFIHTDRERLRFLFFHLVGFLLGPPLEGARLHLKLRSDPQAGVELFGYMISDCDYAPTPTEKDDIELLGNLCRGLDADLITLIDEDQQLQVRVRLPLQL